MAFYETVTNVIDGSWPPTSYYAPAVTGCKGATLTHPGGSPGAIPSSSVRSYSPILIVRRRSEFDRKTSFSKVKATGKIRMTPYWIRSEKTENYVVERRIHLADWRRLTGACRVKTPFICAYDSGPEMFESSWTEKDHIDSLSSSTPHYRYTENSHDHRDKVNQAIKTTQQAAFASAMSTHDILTELMEAKETFRFLFDKVKSGAESLKKFADTDPTTLKRARNKSVKSLLRSSDKALRRFGSRWMEYRYAIMPLIYSFKDVNEWLGKRDAVFKTGRDKVMVESMFERDALSDVCLYDKVSISTLVRSTTKVAYNRGALQRLIAQSSFNPFKTGWELVPYSFVVDWFINVGDALACATSIDLSSTRNSCTTVRESCVIETWFKDSSAVTFSKAFVHDACGNIDVSKTYAQHVNEVIQRRTTESYRRFLYDRPKPTLSFDPYLNWKRFLDGMVLSYRPIVKLLRSL